MIQDRVLFRFAGVAAAAAAVLRLVTATPWPLGGAESREQLYLAVDLLTLLTLFALFASQARLRRGFGVFGFVVAVLGLALIRTGPRIGAFASYEFSASILAVGLAILGAALVGAGGWIRAVGIAWIASLGVGLVGAAMHSPAGFLAASILFCIGLALAARVLFNHQPDAA